MSGLILKKKNSKTNKKKKFNFFVVVYVKKINESEFFFTYDVTGDVRLMKFKFSEITENWYFYIKSEKKNCDLLGDL